MTDLFVEEKSDNSQVRFTNSQKDSKSLKLSPEKNYKKGNSQQNLFKLPENKKDSQQFTSIFMSKNYSTNITDEPVRKINKLKPQLTELANKKWKEVLYHKKEIATASAKKIKPL